MPINDVLPLKATQCNAIANVSFTFAMRHHLIQLASAPFTSFCLAKFGWVPSAHLRVQCLATKQNSELTEGARKLGSYFNPFVECKFMKFCVRDPSYFPMPLPDCLHWLHMKYKVVILLTLNTCKHKYNYTIQVKIS